MRPAALIAFLLLAAAAGAALPEPPGVRIGGADYVSVDDMAALLGLRTERVGTQSVILKEGPRPVARLTERSREIDILGLRLFLGDPVEERSGSLCVSRIDYRARLVPRLRPDLCGPAPARPRVIAVDPGHGGEDQGTSNPRLGLNEKTCTLDVGLRLRRLLEAAGYTVVLTRDSDVDVPKALRPEIANRAGADLFVSIHFNSLLPNTTTTGAEVLTFPPRTQRSTDSWSPGKKDDAETDLAPGNRFDAWNTILAGAVHRRVVEGLRDGDRGEKLMHLAVLRGIHCPAILVESAMLSSDAEGAALTTVEFRERIAEAVFAGIQDYAAMLASGPPAPSRQAPAAATGPGTRASPTRPSAP